MKVAILAPVAWRTPPVHYGPWEQMASNLAENLVKQGVDVTLFASADSITTAKLNAVVKLGYETDRNQDAKVLECLHISNLMENANEFDIIHNHFDFLPLSYSKLIKPPMITTIHGFSSEKILAVYQKYNAHSHYVSISDTNRHPSLNYLATVFNGLNLDEFEFNEIPDDYLLFFGRIHPDKGTAEAIDIAQRANKKLIIAGIIQDQRYFDESVKPHLNDKITFIEAAEPALRNQLMGKALALLHPINFEEPFGLSVVESMLCGTPVIAFNKGSMPEIIKNGENGFLVTHVDEAIEAIQNIQKVNRKTCCDLANHKFSAKKMTDKYIMLYYKILCQN